MGSAGTLLAGSTNWLSSFGEVFAEGAGRRLANKLLRVPQPVQISRAPGAIRQQSSSLASLTNSPTAGRPTSMPEISASVSDSRKRLYGPSCVWNSAKNREGDRIGQFRYDFRAGR